MEWSLKILTGIVILILVAMLGYAGIQCYDCVGIKTSTGEATVTGCTYKAPWIQVTIVGKTPMVISHPEEWWLWMRIDAQQAALHVTESTCHSPIGTVYKVKYGYGRRSGDLIIEDFAP